MELLLNFVSLFYEQLFTITVTVTPKHAFISQCCYLHLQAKEAESRGDLLEAGQKRKAALFCNIAACVMWVMSIVIIIILTISIMSATNF